MTTFRRPDPAPLPPDGLAAALRAGRRRRAVLTASGGAVVAGVTALAVLAGPTGTTHSLDPVAPLPTVESSSPSPSSSPTPDVTSPAATPSSGPTGTEPASAVASPSPSPSPSAGPRWPHHGPMRTGNDGTPPSTWTATGTHDSWLYVGDVTEPERGTYRLSLSFCVHSLDGNPDQGVSFETEKEVDFAVVHRDGDEVWRWSHGQAFAEDPHVRKVRDGECLWWTTDWHGIDDERRPLAAGTYTVRMYVTQDGSSYDPGTEEPVELR